ncbi:MAG: hypothetical protein AABW73_00965 [Nanoarchaeota archaeon]
MNSQKLVLITITIVLILNTIISYNLPQSFIKGLSGLAGSEGYVNITVETIISVNFTQETLNFGPGSIDDGQSNATLETSGPSVLRGNWSTSGMSGLVLENIGSRNVTLTLSTNKNASSLFGGSQGHRRYMWNITSNETGSCSPGALSNSTFRNVNTSGYLFCEQLGYLSDQDTLRIDFLLTIPYDGNSGILSDTITATISAAP